MAFDKNSLKNPENLNRGRSVAEKSQALGASKEVTEAIEAVEKSNSKEMLVVALKKIDSALDLQIEKKKELIDDLSKTFSNLFNFEN